MIPFWITPLNALPSWTLGIGVTGHDKEDAVDFVSRMKIDGFVVDKIKVVQSISELDQNHVFPNMGSVLRRGVWFPLGYDNLT